MPKHINTFKTKKYANGVTRLDYDKLNTNFFEEPNLLQNQKISYESFLNNDLEKLFAEYFPIAANDKNNKWSITFSGLKLIKEKKNFIDEERCRIEGRTFGASLYADLKIVNNETGEAKASKKKTKLSANGILFGIIPMLTNRGTFIINGTEKNVVPQINRAPGLYVLNKSRVKISGKKVEKKGFVCELLPSRGAFILFDVSSHGIYASIKGAMNDSAPNFRVTEILKALGMSVNAINSVFEGSPMIAKTLTVSPHEVEKEQIYTRENIIDDKLIRSFRADISKGRSVEVTGMQTKIRSLVAEYEKLKNDDAARIKIDAVLDQMICEWTAKHLVDELNISTRSIESNKIASSYVDVFSDFIMNKRKYDLLPAGRYKLNKKLQITDRLLNRVIAKDILDDSGKVLFKEGTLFFKEEIDKLKKAAAENKVNFIKKVTTCITPAVTKKQNLDCQSILVYADNNERKETVQLLSPNTETDSRALVLTDILSIISYVSGLPYEIGKYDDVEHLGNKRIRLISEQLVTKLIPAMAKLEKNVKEKLAGLYHKNAVGEEKERLESKAELTSVVNSKPFQQALQFFFNTYSLTQFVDQENPLSELANKRKISATGEGGISHEDPNVELRDIHYTFNGKFCPIDSPEGQNVGLLMHLATFAKIDDRGFVVNPLRKVENGVVTDKVEWLTALQEDEFAIGESILPYDEVGKIKDNEYPCRYNGDIKMFHAKEIDYIDVAPRGSFSVSTSLVPFVGYNEGHRIEMACHMQNQALPLIVPHAPTVGSGMEHKVAKESGYCVVARADGEVEYVDSSKIVIGSENYSLIKYRQSNQESCINQSPIVSVGQKVKTGDVIAISSAMDNVELAIGQNVLTAYMPWKGYNFEDAVIISERLFKEDLLTSINISTHSVKVLRKSQNIEAEEVSRDIPGASAESTRFLDEDGVILVGSEVKEGDVLIGKIRPKPTVDTSSQTYDRFLANIFNNNNKKYKDTSLRVPYGVSGTVCRVQKLSEANGDKIDDDAVEVYKVYIARKLKVQSGDKFAGRYGNKGVCSVVLPQEDMPHMEDGTPIDVVFNSHGVPSRMNLGQIYEANTGMALKRIAIDLLIQSAYEKVDLTDRLGIEESKAEVLNKVVKKYFKELNLTSQQEADKSLGQENLLAQHLSYILSQAGLTIDDLNLKIASPIFTGADIEDVKELMNIAGINPEKTQGKFTLIDGQTGEKFDNPVTVGYTYLLKLNHMIDSKIHARAVGPYTKTTQQPLGGKSKNGGQRVGEMEVWAFEAHGAAYNLRELMTVKSDDSIARNKMYRSIIDGNTELSIPTFVPDSFKYASKLFQGLGLNLTVTTADGQVCDINKFVSSRYTEEEDSFNPPEEKVGEKVSAYSDEKLTLNDEGEIE